MGVFYTISLYLYSFLVGFAGLFNPKAAEWKKGRKNPKWKSINSHGKNVVWFHCASLGEFDQGLPLMDAWKAKFPNDFILVTFFSPSGMLHYHKRKNPADAVDYLPLDTKKNAREFIQTIQPKTVFFVKYEFWGNHLKEAKKSGAALYSVSALFRPNQIYFKWYGGYYRTILTQFDHIFVQNQTSFDLLKKIQIESVSVTGDLRFDRVFQNKEMASKNETLEQFLSGEKALVIGSSWPEDENCLKELINQTDFTKKVIIAPHEINENHLAQIEKMFNKSCIRYTDLTEKTDSNELPKILILNTIGHLTNAYQYGDVAYVGGGFSGNLHNILEPAVFGLPVIFGPKHVKFPEADSFIENGFAFEIADPASLTKAYQQIESTKNEINQRLMSFMSSQTGVADKIITELIH